MDQRLKRAVAMAASGAGLVALVACGPSSTGTGTSAPASTHPVSAGSPATSPTPASASTSTSSPSPETPSSTTAAEKPASPSDPPSPKTTKPPADPNALKSGSSGPEVLAAQQRLSDLGYWLGTPDGKYQGLTVQAVYALQGAAGLKRDGILGGATKEALDKGVRPTPKSTADGTEIDLKAGLLLVIRGGKVKYALHTSTGTFKWFSYKGVKGTADTPRGNWTVTRAIDGVRHADMGDLYRPRYFDDSQGIAVHGYSSVPAYPASHGCARVTFSAMNLIWKEDLMPIGSEVRVY